MTGKTPTDLIPGDMPPELEHVWDWFLTLNSARGRSESGPNPISYQDVQAWCDVTDMLVRPQEVQLIMRIDRLWMEITDEAMRAHFAWMRSQSTNG